MAAPSDWRIVDESTEHYVVVGPDSVGTIVLQANPVIASDANGCEGLAAVDGATTVDGIVASRAHESETRDVHQRNDRSTATKVR